MLPHNMYVCLHVCSAATAMTKESFIHCVSKKFTPYDFHDNNVK